MSRITVVLTLFVLLAMAQAGWAVTLQSDWYVKIQGVNVYTYGRYGPELTTGGYFYETPPGQYGPFAVADPYGMNFARWISVPAAASSVTAADSLTIPVYIPLAEGTALASIGAAFETNYDPNVMNIQLWHTTQAGVSALLWTQSVGGRQYPDYVWAYDTPLDGYYSFTVAIVPEPSALLSLALGFASVVYWRKRR